LGGGIWGFAKENWHICGGIWGAGFWDLGGGIWGKCLLGFKNPILGIWILGFLGFGFWFFWDLEFEISGGL
jgi:hypothetical protein